MLSALIGSVLNGLFNGFWIAFFTGWIAWLSVLRILAAGFYEAYLVTRPLPDLAAAPAEANFSSTAKQGDYESVEMQPPPADDTEYHGGGVPAPGPATDADSSNLIPGPPGLGRHAPVGSGAGLGSVRRTKKFQLQRTVKWSGWLGWAWSALYTPLSHTIWLAVNARNPSNGSVKIVRAIAIGVSALSLTFDTKQRYAAALARKTNSPWVGTLFRAWNALACLLLGGEAAALLVLGAVQAKIFVALPIVYVVFSCIWAWASWKILPPVDGSRPGFHILADVTMGAFAGLFVAAPAFALWQDNVFDEHKADLFGESRPTGLDLGTYLQCEGATLAGKFAAVMP
jgi:hypothetical protein